jgi:hypothetical protein
MKDYFDIAFLAGRFPFQGVELARAIGATFSRRETPIPGEVPMGLTEQFALDEQKRVQWTQFVRRVQGSTGTLGDAVTLVRTFVWPAAQAAASGQPFTAAWASGRWQPNE